MYKVASDSHQRSLHHGRLSDWVHGEEKLSAEDQLRQAVEGIQIVEARILASSGADRKKLGQQKLEMQSRMKSLREQANLERRGFQDDYGQVFIECAREMVDPMKFRLIKAATQKEIDRRKLSERGK